MAENERRGMNETENVFQLKNVKMRFLCVAKLILLLKVFPFFLFFDEWDYGRWQLELLEMINLIMNNLAENLISFNNRASQFKLRHHSVKYFKKLVNYSAWVMFDQHIITALLMASTYIYASIIFENFLFTLFITRVSF